MSTLTGICFKTFPPWRCRPGVSTLSLQIRDLMTGATDQPRPTKLGPSHTTFMTPLTGATDQPRPTKLGPSHTELPDVPYRYDWRCWRPERNLLRPQLRDREHSRPPPSPSSSSFGSGRRSRPHRRCWTARADLGERWSSRLVATATAIRLITCEHLLRIAGPGLSAPHAATLAPAFASKGRAASSNRPT